MRKSVRIPLLVVPALLVIAAGVLWGLVLRTEQVNASRDAALRERLDSLSEAVTILAGMDSLYRAQLRMDPVPADSVAPGLPESADSLSRRIRETYAYSLEYRERARCIPSICPLAPGTFRLTARFGTRQDPIEGDSRIHDGLDLACPQGNPVHVTADGVVSFIDSDIFGYGNCIIVDHGYGFQTRYAHLSVIRTSENIRLKRGDVIGETGVSGRATGPHLHYEVILDGQTVDPEQYINGEL